MQGYRELPAQRMLSNSLLAGGVACFLVAVVFCVHFYTAAPYADSWNIVDEIVMNHGRVSPGMLWALHNEHRMAIPKLLMWADLFWFRDKGWSLFAEIYAVQLLAALIVLYAVRRLGGWSWVESRAALGVALFCLFCPAQWETFIWIFGIQVAPPYALGALAFVALARYAEKPGRLPMAVALFSAFAAPLHLAGGQIVWPMLCIAAWNLRLRMRTIAMLALCGAISISAYFIGYVNPPKHADAMTSLRQPGALAQYLLLYFAGSWDGVGRPLGYALAAVSIGAVFVWSVKTVIRRDESGLRVAMLAIAGTLIVNAFVTAVGRLSFGIEQATASRYQTPALLFWCCIFVLCLDALRQWAPNFVPMVSVAALAAMLAGAAHVSTPWRAAAKLADQIETGTVPLVATVKDDPVISSYLIGTPFLVFRDTGFLRARGLSVYDSFAYRRMGSRVNDLYDVAPAGRCAGYFDSVKPIPDPEWPGHFAAGWSWDNQQGTTIERIVLANEANVIIGLARGGLERGDVKKLVPGVTSSFTGWSGYVNGGFSWRRGKAFGELPGGHLVCALAGGPVRP